MVAPDQQVRHIVRERREPFIVQGIVTQGLLRIPHRDADVPRFRGKGERVVERDCGAVSRARSRTTRSVSLVPRMSSGFACHPAAFALGARTDSLVSERYTVLIS